MTTPTTIRIELAKDSIAERWHSHEWAHADRFALHFAARYRDVQAETVDLYASAARWLSTGELTGLIRDAELPRIRAPAHFLSVALGDALRQKRRALRRAREVAVVTADRWAIPAGATA